VRLENEVVDAKGAPRSPPTRNRPLAAVLNSPATMAVLTAVLVVLTLLLVVLTTLLVVITMAPRSRAKRPVVV
jgi:4-hydroxybenzoate polyprenyltransferase